jgi:hypothetical protein
MNDETERRERQLRELLAQQSFTLHRVSDAPSYLVLDQFCRIVCPGTAPDYRVSLEEVEHWADQWSAKAVG